MRDDSAEILFHFFFFPQEALLSSSGMCRYICPLFDNIAHSGSAANHSITHPPRCPDGWFWRGCHGVRHMSEPCKFLSLDSRKKRFLLTYKEADLALYPVIGLVLQVEDLLRSFLMHLVSKAWILFSESASRVYVSQE